jgi:hypothetical protein
MQILIDNKDIESYFSIKVLDYTGAFDFPAEREDQRVWSDKSGVDKNLDNIRYDAKEFVLSCYCKSTTLAGAYALVNTLIEYMFSKGVFVLSFRDTGVQECFLCERSSTIVGSINIRQQNSLYAFKLGLKDVNPNALKFKTTIALLSASITYTQGKTAVIFWGDGERGQVSNSGVYTKTYAANGKVDIIIDIDKGDSIAPPPVVLPLVAAFSASPLSGEKELSVQFTDATTGGDISIWAWDFGDGESSSEQNPLHIYREAGTFTVTLQVFNSVQGFDSEVKTNYITVNKAELLINETDALLISTGNKIIKN